MVSQCYCAWQILVWQRIDCQIGRGGISLPDTDENVDGHEDTKIPPSHACAGTKQDVPNGCKETEECNKWSTDANLVSRPGGDQDDEEAEKIGWRCEAL